MEFRDSRWARRLRVRERTTEDPQRKIRGSVILTARLQRLFRMAHPTARVTNS